MPIKGLTDIERTSLPRVGALRKGGEKQTKTSKNGKEYQTWGKDLDHFRFTSDDPSVLSDFVDAYGDAPRTINILLPYRTTGENFPTWKKEYSAGGLVHTCDGEFVTRYRNNKGEIVNVPAGTMKCPYEMREKSKKRTINNPGCLNNARLNVIIPELKRFAIVEMHTSAINDIVHIDDLLRDFEQRFGTLQGIPFTLTRVHEGISTPDGKGGRARRKKWMVHLVAQREWSALQITGMQHQAAPQLVSSATQQLPSGESVYLETGEIVSEQKSNFDDISFSNFEGSVDEFTGEIQEEPPFVPDAFQDAEIKHQYGGGQDGNPASANTSPAPKDVSLIMASLQENALKSDKPASEKQVKLMMQTLGELCDTEKMKRSVMMFLFTMKSGNDATGGQASAIIEWGMLPSNNWKAAPESISQAHAIYKAALIHEGQLELFKAGE